MIVDDIKLDYSDVMLLPQCGDINGPNSRAEINLLNSDGHVGIIAANMGGIGTFEMAKALYKFNIPTALHKHYDIDDLVYWYKDFGYVDAIYSMGANEKDMIKWTRVHEILTKKKIATPNTVCIDVANGYTEATAEFIRNFRHSYNAKIIAGNVVTPDGVRYLANAGANVIKIGIGSGSVCTTRKLTGIGYPQFSAIVDCVDMADLLSVKLIADGGITCPGDVAKALAAGADYVMIGGMFAGHDEGGGMPCDSNGNVPYISPQTGYTMNLMPLNYRKFYGMASKSAQDKYNGGVAEYRASEGKEVVVPYRGPIKNTVQEILGGLRSSCAYQGVKNLSDISKNPKFIRVNNQLNNVFGA